MKYSTWVSGQKEFVGGGVLDGLNFAAGILKYSVLLGVLIGFVGEMPKSSRVEACWIF